MGFMVLDPNNDRGHQIDVIPEKDQGYQAVRIFGKDNRIEQHLQSDCQPQIASMGNAIAVFLAARLMIISPRLFLIPDAAVLTTFGIAGTLVSLMMGTPWKAIRSRNYNVGYTASK